MVENTPNAAYWGWKNAFGPTTGDRSSRTICMKVQSGRSKASISPAAQPATEQRAARKYAACDGVKLGSPSRSAPRLGKRLVKNGMFGTFGLSNGTLAARKSKSTEAA